MDKISFITKGFTGSLLLIHIEILGVCRDDLLVGHGREGTATVVIPGRVARGPVWASWYTALAEGSSGSDRPVGAE